MGSRVVFFLRGSCVVFFFSVDFLGNANVVDFTKRFVDTGYLVEKCHVYVGFLDHLNHLNSVSIPQTPNLWYCIFTCIWFISTHTSWIHWFCTLPLHRDHAKLLLRTRFYTFFQTDLLESRWTQCLPKTKLLRCKCLQNIFHRLFLFVLCPQWIMTWSIRTASIVPTRRYLHRVALHLQLGAWALKGCQLKR